MTLTDSISYVQFHKMMDTCFPGEILNSNTFLNNCKKKRFLFSEKNGVPTGYLHYTPHENPIRLIHLCVAKAYRGKGIGKFLLDNLVRIVEKIGTPYVILNVDSTNHGAIRFYRRLGFYQTGASYQYRYIIPQVEKSQHDYDLRRITETDLALFLELFDLGPTMTDYFIQSRKNELFLLLDTKQKMLGYTVYEKESHTFSPIVLIHPHHIKELLNCINQALPEDTEIRLNSLSSEIYDYIIQIPNVVVDYHLVQMKLDISDYRFV